ncbi:hypothetical protein HELRODRAFT_178464 [Helobdella robusta]|uniref:Uncharacterized protein n=1 Tax=Helobdella robusta TaxID=6412 RepID=T1FD72_HELRO|nr:hypothetical protein HELRODRAFT_178464 [Helobdella robusta]ESN97021.1 hypothetical protein HELRODRAFT_178464 [Helobdella robusta]
MAAAVNCVQNKLLYFVFNNFKMFENEELLSNVVSFYSIDAINNAKQQILADWEAANTECVKNWSAKVTSLPSTPQPTPSINVEILNELATSDTEMPFMTVDRSKKRPRLIAGANNKKVFLSFTVHFQEKTEGQNQDENTEHAIAFRVCINREDITKMRYPEIWPSQDVVRDWVSKERQAKKQSSNK